MLTEKDTRDLLTQASENWSVRRILDTCCRHQELFSGLLELLDFHVECRKVVGLDVVAICRILLATRLMPSRYKSQLEDEIAHFEAVLKQLVEIGSMTEMAGRWKLLCTVMSDATASVLPENGIDADFVGFLCDETATDGYVHPSLPQFALPSFVHCDYSESLVATDSSLFERPPIEEWATSGSSSRRKRPLAASLPTSHKKRKVVTKSISSKFTSATAVSFYKKLAQKSVSKTTTVMDIGAKKRLDDTRREERKQRKIEQVEEKRRAVESQRVTAEKKAEKRRLKREAKESKMLKKKKKATTDTKLWKQAQVPEAVVATQSQTQEAADNSANVQQKANETQWQRTAVKSKMEGIPAAPGYLPSPPRGIVTPAMRLMPSPTVRSRGNPLPAANRRGIATPTVTAAVFSNGKSPVVACSRRKPPVAVRSRGIVPTATSGGMKLTAASGRRMPPPLRGRLPFAPWSRCRMGARVMMPPPMAGRMAARMRGFPMAAFGRGRVGMGQVPSGGRLPLVPGLPPPPPLHAFRGLMGARQWPVAVGSSDGVALSVTRQLPWLHSAESPLLSEENRRKIVAFVSGTLDFESESKATEDLLLSTVVEDGITKNIFCRLLFNERQWKKLKKKAKPLFE